MVTAHPAEASRLPRAARAPWMERGSSMWAGPGRAHLSTDVSTEQEGPGLRSGWVPPVVSLVLQCTWLFGEVCPPLGNLSTSDCEEPSGVSHVKMRAVPVPSPLVCVHVRVCVGDVK